MFGIPNNIGTAAMEDIYEGLCWLYIAVRSTIVYDDDGLLPAPLHTLPNQRVSTLYA